MNTLGMHGVAVLCAASAWAQPLPPTVEERETLRRIEMHPPPLGSTVWQTPAPHELQWYIAYDPTPLTVDGAEFEIRLVNDGRPVRAPYTESENQTRLKLSLTLPDQTTRFSKPGAGSVYVDNAGTDNGLIAPAEPVARIRFALFEHFGALKPGTYTLRVEMDAPAELQRARDGHVISDRLALSTPSLRFEVVDHPVPEITAEDHEIVLDLNTEGDESLSSTIRGTLTNPLDVPITLSADTGWDPSWKASEDSPAHVYNAIERWTEGGWLRDASIGYCGVGMSDVTIEPGGSIPVALFAPHVHDRSAGIYRCVVSAVTPDGEGIDFVTAPITIERLPK